MKRLGMIAVMALVVAACQEQQEPAQQDPADLVRPAKIAEARAGAAEYIKIFPGVTEAARRSTLAFRVSGQVVNLPVRAGQLMKKGALIAKLEDSAYRNNLADKKARYQLAKTEFERQEVLFKRKHIAKSRLDTARSNFEAAEAAWKLARNDLGYTRLVAPYDGMISRINIDNFQNIQAKEPIVQFQGAEDINIVFSVPENIFLRLSNEARPEDDQRNQPIDIRFDSMPDRSFQARYKEHDTLPDATTRSFQVTASMPLPKDLTVLPGMSVSAHVDLGHLLNQGQEGVLVPVESVFDDAGKKWVWKLDGDNRASKTEVSVAGIEDRYIRILSGLDDKDRLIAVGVAYIREGQQVRPYVKERGL